MDFEFEILGEKSISITKYTGSAESVVIPNVIQNLPVKYIGYGAFSNCGTLVSITIPDTINHIADDAFIYCDNLKKISFPDIIPDIGANVFSGCKNLESANFTSYYQYKKLVQDYGFPSIKNVNCRFEIELGYDSEKDIEWIIITKYNEDAEFVSIPDIFQGTSPVNIGVTSIGEGAFSQCFNIKELMLPEPLTSIGHGAFSHCENINKIKFPATLVSIGDLAFWDCKSINKIAIPISVKSIGKGAFKACSNLKFATISRHTKYEVDTFPKTTKIIYRSDDNNLIDGNFNPDDFLP